MCSKSYKSKKREAVSLRGISHWLVTRQSQDEITKVAEDSLAMKQHQLKQRNSLTSKKIELTKTVKAAG